MEWINIIVDSADSSLPESDSCRYSKAICCEPDDKSQTLLSTSGVTQTCEVEHLPTEVCYYTKGDTVFRIMDNTHQVPGTLVLEVN